MSELYHVKFRYGAKVHYAEYFGGSNVNWFTLCGLGSKEITISEKEVTCLACIRWQAKNEGMKNKK